MKRAEAERLILKSGWLAERPPEVRAEILGRCQVLLPKPGSFLRLAGDDAGGIYGIASGGIGIQLPLATEEQALVHVSRRGTWFGYFLARKPIVLPMSYLVMEPSVLLHLPLAQLRELQTSRPWMEPHLHALAEYSLTRAIANVTNLLIRNPARRIAASLLRIAPKAEDGAPANIAISQEQLGEIANAARDVVNRALKQFEVKGWISVGYRSVTLLRREEIARFVKSGS
jgi:CRP/FNR family transcriptional regulator, cyclic AMP receptor protein